MDNVARIKRQRSWLLIGSAVVAALGLAAIRFAGLGEPQPVGVYVIYWLAATVLSGLIILLAYVQAVRLASRIRVLGKLSEAAGSGAERDRVVGELQDAFQSAFGLRLMAFVDTAGEVCFPDQTDDDQPTREAVTRLLHVIADADSRSRQPYAANVSEIEDVAGEAALTLLGETLVILPGILSGSTSGTAMLAGPRRRRFDEEQLRYMALLWSNVSWSFGLAPEAKDDVASLPIDEFEELVSQISSPQDIGEMLERMAVSVSETTLMNEIDGVGLLLVDTEDGSVVASGGAGRLLEWNSRSGIADKLTFDAGDAASNDGDLVNYSLAGDGGSNGSSPTFKGAVFLESLGLDHLLAAPVLQDAKLVGAVVAVRGYPYGKFQREEEERLLQFAAAAAKPMSKAFQLAAEMDRLKHMNRMAAFKSELVYNISHELRTSLSSLKAATDMLQETDGVKPGGDTYHRLLNSIARNVARQESLVSNIVDMAGIEEASLDLRLEWVDLTSVMTETSSIMSPLISQRSQTLAVSIEQDLPQILADRQRLSQILVNLVSNAQKYSPEGTDIAFSVERRGPNVVFTVSDSGPGVPPEERARVFEAFYRAQHQRSQGVPGSGLGLAITKSLVELHAGTIWIEDGPMGGAAFLVSLPIGGNA